MLGLKLNHSRRGTYGQKVINGNMPIAGVGNERIDKNNNISKVNIY